MDLETTRSRVRDYLVDLPSETDALIDAWINQAIRSAEDRYNFRYMDATHEATTVEDTRKLDDKPSNWKEAGSSPWLLRDDGSTPEIRWAPSDSEMLRRYDTADTDDDGEPAYILELDAEFHVFPFPDGDSDYDDGEYRVRLPYKAYSAALVNNADTAALMNLAPFYAVFYAVQEGLLFNRDEQRAGVYAQKAEIEYRRAVNRDKRSRLPSRMVLVPRLDVFGPALPKRRSL